MLADARPPLELVADIREILDLYGAIIDPIIERLQPEAAAQLGLIEVVFQMAELRLHTEVMAQVRALPGDPRGN